MEIGEKDKMYFCKLGFVGASVLLGCWAVVQANPASLGAQHENLLAAEAAPSDNDASIQDELLSRSARCTTPSGIPGVCRSFIDCAFRGAKSEGNCGFLGLSVCCIPNLGENSTVSCKKSTSIEEAVFLRPVRNNPADEGMCSLTITPSNDTCQLRLDFTQFSLAQPDLEGVCATSYLTVTGGSTIPKICGDNDGQHMFVDVTPGTDVVLEVTSGSDDDKWNIKATQLSCSSDDLSPTDCLQYFTDTSGTITSFNYDDSSELETFQLSDQSYNICIKEQEGFCSITFAQAEDSPFSVSLDSEALPPSLPPLPLVDGDCTTDYIELPGATITDNSNIGGNPTTADSFCGLAFPGATSTAQPYMLKFVSDENEGPAGDSYNKGFRLDYTLNACE
ncbi:CUB domain [Trinorchestia longiramus]|nr:CUB domain [Trinorchestia longiramus]